MPQIHANCRIRRVYFSDRLYSEDELPAEFKLYLPVQNKSPAKVRPYIPLVLCEILILILSLYRSHHRKHHHLPQPKPSADLYIYIPSTCTMLSLYNILSYENVMRTHREEMCYVLVAVVLLLSEG